VCTQSTLIGWCMQLCLCALITVHATKVDQNFDFYILIYMTLKTKGNYEWLCDSDPEIGQTVSLHTAVRCTHTTNMVINNRRSVTCRNNVHIHFYWNVTTLRSGLCYRKSICHQSVICNVGAPYSGGRSFRRYFFTGVYLGHPLTSVQNFT